MQLLLGEPMLALYKGLATSASLIIAIGAQNAFVLTQALQRRYPLTIATICSAFDALFIGLGVAGLGILVTQSPDLLIVTRWLGVIFLSLYGLRAFISAWRSNRMEIHHQTALSLKQVILTTLFITLANPHVYLDTIVLIGSIGSQQAPDLRVWFALGAMSFSVVWFFSLACGARWLLPLFRKPLAWRILDLCVAVIMWRIAYSLINL